MPGIVKLPATCGVTRTTVVVGASVAPLMNSMRRDRSTTRNSNPDTSGKVMGCVSASRLVIVSCADSPMVISAGSIVALTNSPVATAGAMASNATISAISSAPRIRLILMSPILVGLFRRLIHIASVERHRGSMPLVRLRRIEEFARLLATHLTRQMHDNRGQRVLRARLRRAAGPVLARRLTGRGSRWRRPLLLRRRLPRSLVLVLVLVLALVLVVILLGILFILEFID